MSSEYLKRTYSAKICFHFIPTPELTTYHKLGDAVGRALYLRSTGPTTNPTRAKLRNNLGQVFHTYVPLSPSSITWYWPRGGDALWFGR